MQIVKGGKNMDTKLFKKNKFTFFIIVFFLIVFVLLLQVKNLFFPSSDTANYGHRLDGLTEIKSEVVTALTEKLKENKKVETVSTNTNGRIFNIIITVGNEATKKEAKTIGESTISSLDEETLKQYDIQVFMKKTDKEETDFPLIGYKSTNDETLSWSRDREKKTEGEK